jgi:hypothetical protein
MGYSEQQLKLIHLRNQKENEMPKMPNLENWTYEKMAEKLQGLHMHNWKPLYYETKITWNEEEDFSIAVMHHQTVVAVVYSDGSVELCDAGGNRGTWHSRYRTSTDGTFTETTKRRLDYLLLANCHKRLTSMRRTLKVYDIATGQYTDFRKGMVVTK